MHRHTNRHGAKTLESVTKEQADSLGTILTAFQQGNPASLSDELSVNFLPIFQKGQENCFLKI